MEDKETPIFITRTFRCPNCESRNLKWEKWGSDPDVKKKNLAGYTIFMLCGLP